MIILLRLFPFNHIRELHHSQTDVDTQQEDHAFNHIRELHHSQTGGSLL